MLSSVLVTVLVTDLVMRCCRNNDDDDGGQALLTADKTIRHPSSAKGVCVCVLDECVIPNRRQRILVGRYIQYVHARRVAYLCSCSKSSGRDRGDLLNIHLLRSKDFVLHEFSGDLGFCYSIGVGGYVACREGCQVRRIGR